MAEETETFRILLVEDDTGDARLLRQAVANVRDVRFEVVHAATLADAVLHAAAEPFDVVLLDLGLPDEQGLTTFSRAHVEAPGVPIVVLTGFDDEAVGLRAVQEGAQDYLVKGRADGTAIVRALRYAVERTRRQRADALRRGQTAHLWKALFRTLGRGASAILYRAGIDAGEGTHDFVSATWQPKSDASLFHALREYFSSTGVCDLRTMQVNRAALRVMVEATGTFEGTQHTGRSEVPVCHFLRGIFCGIAGRMFGAEEVVCDEVRCQAHGDPACEFLVHPLFT